MHIVYPEILILSAAAMAADSVEEWNNFKVSLKKTKKKSFPVLKNIINFSQS